MRVQHLVRLEMPEVARRRIQVGAIHTSYTSYAMNNEPRQPKRLKSCRDYDAFLPLASPISPTECRDLTSVSKVAGISGLYPTSNHSSIPLPLIHHSSHHYAFSNSVHLSPHSGPLGSVQSCASQTPPASRSQPRRSISATDHHALRASQLAPSSCSIILSELRLIMPQKRAKTGCFSCRKRRVKCDEAKPECQRCKSANVHCEGYPAKKLLSANVPEKMLERRMSSYSSGPLDVGNDALLNVGNVALPFYHQFITQTVYAISGGTRQKFWREDVARMAWSTDYIYHAMIGLAAMHKTSNDASRGRPSPPALRTFALQNYQQAIGLLSRDSNASALKPMQVLATLTLFAYFEVSSTSLVLARLGNGIHANKVSASLVVLSAYSEIYGPPSRYSKHMFATNHIWTAIKSTPSFVPL